MADYVSRQYLLDEYDRQHQGPPGGARKIIALAPAADVVHVKEVEEAYQKGLNDAWECAKKIVHLQWDGAWAGVDEVEKWFDTYTASEAIEKIIEKAPAEDVVPREPQEIGYDQCANAILKMWMDNVVTDREYSRIMDKLNKYYGKS